MKKVASDRTDKTYNDPAKLRKKRFWKRQQLRIATWNVTSIANKDQQTIIELKKHKIDICALSETKKKGAGNFRIAEYTLIYNGKPKDERAASGVGLLVHEKYDKNIKYISDRLLQTTFKFTETTKTHILSVYAPDTSKSQEETDSFYDELQITMDKIPKQDEIMILGDFNGRIGNEVISGIKNRFNEKTLNSNGEQLIQFCAHNELRINNTFYPHKQQHKYTFENTRGHKSIIDYIITNRNIHPSKILDVRTLTSVNTGTNHHMVLAIMRNCVQWKTQNKPKVTEKLNIESLSDDTTKYLYQQRLRKAINENKILKDDTVELARKRLSTNIRTAAEEALGKRKVKLNGKPNTKPWFTNEIKSLAEEKRKAYLQYRSQTITYADYKVVRNRTNMEIQTIKRQFWEKYSSDMENDLYGGEKKIWNMIRNIKRPIN
ncbi:craniofacial development protein 2-like [Diorhabda sublineata]|uniref:craniofacial development protein 2-like n=1 Tax=Diorhabda sublineata TaxID=1163346 RepID=UPI0024E098C6|nr:craniofacial development protein 2-like [Diorhabda sublineata]